MANTGIDYKEVAAEFVAIVFPSMDRELAASYISQGSELLRKHWPPGPPQVAPSQEGVDQLDRLLTLLVGEKTELAPDALHIWEEFHLLFEAETCEQFESGLREGAKKSIVCQARKQGTAGGNLPADCNWPFCGCDPKAAEVLSALQECGKTFEDGVKSVPIRKKLPKERTGVTHKFQLGAPENKGYVTVNTYADGTPGEVFIRMAKMGSTINGFLDSLAIVMSIALQHGVPLQAITSKLSYTRFEPDGYSGPELRFASSVSDYLARWLEQRYINKQPAPQVPEGLFTATCPRPDCGRKFVAQTPEQAQVQAEQCTHLPVPVFNAEEKK